MRVTAAFYIQCGFKVLMTNPMHLLVKPGGPRSLPRTMQWLGRRTVRAINARVRRAGREGRYRAAPIDSEACFLACCRTIELNPMRARMVRHPRDDAWSSYNAHARRVRWIRFSAVMRSLTGLGLVRPTVGRRTGNCFAGRAMRISPTRCVPRRTADDARFATRASSGRSPRL
jgi:hypothetical protein